MRHVLKRVVPPVPSQNQLELVLFATKDGKWTQNIEDAARFDQETADRAKHHAMNAFNGEFTVELEPIEIIHILYAGASFCDMRGFPNEWPNGHVWVGLDAREKANCPGCQVGAEKHMLKQRNQN